MCHEGCLKWIVSGARSSRDLEDGETTGGWQSLQEERTPDGSAVRTGEAERAEKRSGEGTIIPGLLAGRFQGQRRAAWLLLEAHVGEHRVRKLRMVWLR